MIEMIKHFFPCKIHRSNKSHLFHFIWHGTPMRNVQLPLREQSSVHVCLSFWKGPEALTKLESPPDSTLHSVLCLPPTLVPSFLRFSLSLKSKKVPLYIQKTFESLNGKMFLNSEKSFVRLSSLKEFR